MSTCIGKNRTHHWFFALFSPTRNGVFQKNTADTDSDFSVSNRYSSQNLTYSNINPPTRTGLFTTFKRFYALRFLVKLKPSRPKVNNAMTDGSGTDVYPCNLKTLSNAE